MCIIINYYCFAFLLPIQIYICLNKWKLHRTVIKIYVKEKIYLRNKYYLGMLWNWCHHNAWGLLIECEGKCTLIDSYIRVSGYFWLLLATSGYFAARLDYSSRRDAWLHALCEVLINSAFFFFKTRMLCFALNLLIINGQ